MDNFVGPYRILRLIKQGGQGSVYLGYDKRLHRRVAIRYSLPSTRAARRQLLREARTVASIQSHKVVQIHDVIESSTHLAMVMEYVPGCSLEDFLTAVPSLASVLTVGTDVAGALALARQNHIVHGDVARATCSLKAGAPSSRILVFPEALPTAVQARGAQAVCLPCRRAVARQAAG